MKTGSTLAIVVFVLVAIAHVLRLIYSAEVTVEGTVIPQWASVIGVLVPGLITFMLWRERRS